jgi:hypothetical protein
MYKLKKTTICYRVKAMIHSDQINIINITSNTEWNHSAKLKHLTIYDLVYLTMRILMIYQD